MPISSCPVCASTDLLTAQHVSSGEAAQCWIVAESDAVKHTKLKRHIEKLWNGETCALRRCASCKFGFPDPFVGGDQVFYELAFPRDGYPADRFEFYRTRDVIKTLQLNGPLLEVGAGPGHFLRLVSPDLVAPQDVVALEFNRRCLKIIDAMGHEAIEGDLRSALAPSRKFQIVCMFQALEHIDDPEAIFGAIDNVLRPGGHLFISVPNQDRVDWDESHDSLQDMPPNHVGRWRVESFRAVADRFGLELIEHDVNPVGLYDFWKLDLFYSYLRASQKPGTIANRTRAYRTKPGGKMVGLAGAAIHAPSRLRHLRNARDNLSRLGDTLWVHLRKSPEASG